jgi:hypothetical protein
MLFHPGIDGGIPLDGAVESQEVRFHRGTALGVKSIEAI